MSDWSSDVCSSDLVVIVDRHRQHALGIVLSDHIIVQHLAYLMRGRHTVARLHQRGLGLLAADIIAQLHTLVADEHRPSELGRAPSRDRVCQYVPIPDVARYIKHKPTPTTPHTHPH